LLWLPWASTLPLEFLSYSKNAAKEAREEHEVLLVDRKWKSCHGGDAIMVRAFKPNFTVMTAPSTISLAHMPRRSCRCRKPLCDIFEILVVFLVVVGPHSSPPKATLKETRRGCGDSLGECEEILRKLAGKHRAIEIPAICSLLG